MKRIGKFTKNTILWILTVFFALTFLVYIPHIASFISLILAVILAPIQKWQTFLTKYIKAKFKVLATIVLFILTVFVLPTKEISNNNIPNETTLAISEETTESVEETTPPTKATTEPTTAPTTEPPTEATVEPTTEPTTAPTTVPTTELAAEEYEEMVWIPKSGSKYHSKASCSGMDDPSEVPLSEAERRGFTPCKRCH